MERKSLSKRIRFEIFKRDGFRCLYCGGDPTKGVVLVVDHVLAVSRGGTDVADNLVTSCDDCNSGKSNVSLDDRKYRPLDPESAREHAEQLRAFLDAQKEVVAAKRSIEDEVAAEWERAFGCGPAKSLYGRFTSLVGEHGLDALVEAINIVASHPDLGAHRYDSVSRGQSRIRYFYGILRRRRERGQQPAAADVIERRRLSESECAALVSRNAVVIGTVLEAVDAANPIDALFYFEMLAAGSEEVDLDCRDGLVLLNDRRPLLPLPYADEFRERLLRLRTGKLIGLQWLSTESAAPQLEPSDHARVALPIDLAGIVVLDGDPLPENVTETRFGMKRWITQWAYDRLGFGKKG